MIVWRMHNLVQSNSSDSGLHVVNGVSPDAADDMGDAPHRLNVYVTDVPRDESVASERLNT